MRHEKKMGGAGTGNPEHRPDPKIADGLTHSSNGGTSVPCAADTGPLFDAPKAARASMYAPAGRRRYWWFAYQCALREAHLGRVEAKTAEEAREKASRRYARCGGIRIPVRVERVYGEAAYV